MKANAQSAKAAAPLTAGQEWELRGIAASNLLCWHRLTEAEAKDLLAFIDTAAGEGLVLNGVDAADLCTSIFPEVAAHGITTPPHPEASKQEAQGWQVPEGEIVITKNDAGHIVAVTRQNSEGVILNVLALSAPIYAATPKPQQEVQGGRVPDSVYQLVGEVQTLHELNDSWIQHLPCGTALYAKSRTNVGSDGLSDEDRAAMRFQLDQWASSCAANPTWRPISSAPMDGTEVLLRSKKGRIADGCWVAVNGDKGYWAWALVNQEPVEWTPIPGGLAATPKPQAEPAPSAAVKTFNTVYAQALKDSEPGTMKDIARLCYEAAHPTPDAAQMDAPTAAMIDAGVRAGDGLSVIDAGTVEMIWSAMVAQKGGAA